MRRNESNLPRYTEKEAENTEKIVFSASEISIFIRNILKKYAVIQKETRQKQQKRTRHALVRHFIPFCISIFFPRFSAQEAKIRGRFPIVLSASPAKDTPSKKRSAPQNFPSAESASKVRAQRY